MKILGIDPGITGGLAELRLPISGVIYADKRIFISAFGMPTVRIETKPKRLQLDLDYSTTKTGKKQFIKSGPNKGQVKMKIKSPAKYKKELDVKRIYDIFKQQDIIVIEKQNPQPGNSAASSASTMRNYGKLLALAELSGAKLILVAPMTWKKHFNLDLAKLEKNKLTPTEYKKLSIDKAYQLSKFNTTSDGVADAICISYWQVEEERWNLWTQYNQI